MRYSLLLMCLLAFLGLAACKNDVQAEEATSEHSFNPQKGPVQPICSTPAPIQDIWKLEPMLIEKGLITEDMDREQRETVIRDYINKKNSAYDQCLKGS